MAECSFALPHPPSVNRLWRHPTSGRLAGRHLLSASARKYRDEVAQALMLQRVRWSGERSASDRLEVQLLVHHPDRRKRDIDNIVKIVLDSVALARPDLIHDDCLIDNLFISRLEPTKGGLVRVTLLTLNGARHATR